MHHLLRGEAAQVHSLLEQAAQVAVGEDAEHAAPLVGDRSGAEAFLRHLAHHFDERRLRQHARHRVAAAHHVAHMREQLASEAAARVRSGEVVFAKSARVEQRDRERIAERHLRRRAGGRREVQGAGFLIDRAADDDVGVLGERGLGPPGHRDDRDADALQRRQDHRELVDLARVGDREHDVTGRDHAEVAMTRLGRVNEHRRRAGRRERRRDLAADMAALAHAHHDHPAAALEHRLDGAGEALALARFHAEEGLRLDVESLVRELQRALRIERGFSRRVAGRGVH